MLKVGLTGGYATGKSFVAAEFARLGCVLIYADQLGHEVLRKTGAAYDPALELLGPSVLDAEGEMDRKKVAALVFADPALLQKLTAIVHPAVFEREEQIIAQAGAHAIVIVEAAILVETGRYSVFEKLIVTACEPEVQIARAMERTGESRQAVLTRLARQLPTSEKVKHADFVIDTSGAKESTLQQVEHVYLRLRQAEAEKR